MTDRWFDDIPVLGVLPPAQAAEKLRALGATDEADALEEALEDQPATTFAGTRGFAWPWKPRAWQHTEHAFGYLAPLAPGASEPQPIRYAGNMPADESLKHGRIKITLDRLFAAEYPGGGTHHVLFAFYAQNQLPGNVEEVNFNATYRVRQGQHAGLIGYPIFVGLNVGTEGVAFKCRTVNVKNEDDESLLDFLDSDVFQSGLRLAATAQPAIAPLSAMAVGLTRTLLGRRENVAVQDFYMGLDFSGIPTRARLAEGVYLAVQISENLRAVWDWQGWVYNPNNGLVVSRDNLQETLPYNYVGFSVSRYEED